MKKLMSLPYARLLFAMLFGVILGLALQPYSNAQELQTINTHILTPIGQIFLRLIFMAVVPLILSALILGVYELAQGADLGPVALRTLKFTLVASALSVVIGITLVNVFKPGAHVDHAVTASLTGADQTATLQKNVTETKPISVIITELFTKNPVDSAARALSGEIVSLMVFALIFGLALSRAYPSPTESPVLIRVLEQVYAASMKIIEFAMKLAPAGVFALVFGSVFKFGVGILLSLGMYVLLVIVGLLLQQFVVYGALLKVFTKRSPMEFFKACSEVYLYAFSTASSNATLPKTLDLAENKLGISPRIGRFVLTIGSTANQNGTALFEGITVLFLAQVYGLDLTTGQQVQVVLMSILAGIGTAGVPGGSLPLIMILCQSLGIPAEGMGLILGVDRFLDMARTTLNVSGDLVIAALVDTPSVDGDAEHPTTPQVAEAL